VGGGDVEGGQVEANAAAGPAAAPVEETGLNGNAGVAGSVCTATRDSDWARSLSPSAGGGESRIERVRTVTSGSSLPGRDLLSRFPLARTPAPGRDLLSRFPLARTLLTWKGISASSLPDTVRVHLNGAASGPLGNQPASSRWEVGGGGGGGGGALRGGGWWVARWRGGGDNLKRPCELTEDKQTKGARSSWRTARERQTTQTTRGAAYHAKNRGG
jgi:hypothetical protein